MANKIKIKTPFGIAVYPKISQPDTYGDFADGKFKTKLEFDGSDLARVRKQLTDIAAELLPKVKRPKLPIQTLPDGREVLIAKTKNRPPVFDTRNNPIPKKVGIGGGSIIRIECTVGTYPKGNPTGINLYLNSVQVKKLVEYTPGGHFDEVDDGYVYEGGDEDDEDIDSRKDDDDASDF